MINKKLLKYLISATLIVLSIKVQSQILDSLTLLKAPIHSLENALKLDPLKVYKLSLKRMKLTELPEEIFEFKNLQVLNLRNNKFQIFPKKIVVFKYLQELNLTANKIEIVTKELGELTHLKRFIAGSNKIKSIPPEIQHLKKLEYLDLWGNEIGFLPYEIQELKNTLIEIDMRVILMSKEEHQKIKALLPKTKIKFSKACNCGF